jgi:hypothetical protein
MRQGVLRQACFKLTLLLLLGVLAPIGEGRSNVRIHELPDSLVERVAYLGKGEFEVTVTPATRTAGGKPRRYFDGTDTLTFLIQAESLDGTVVESTKTSAGSLRSDSRLSGAEFVNLLVSKAVRRESIRLSCAFVPADEHRPRNMHRLAYFQVNGDQG